MVMSDPASSLRMISLAGLALVVMGGCSRFRPSYDNLPCEDGECLSNYTCHPELKLCVRPLTVTCAGGGLCPTSVQKGQECPHIHAFIPCAPEATGCERGCRTCVEDPSTGQLTWSDCSQADCIATGPEICDGVDNDCDGQRDNGDDLEGCSVFLLDEDADGFGVDGSGRCLCAATEPHAALVGGDCDDLDRYTHLGAAELCDGNDNDCTHGVPSNEEDGDGDGYVLCAPWEDVQGDDGDVLGGSDCDDSPSRCGSRCFPGNAVADICDTVDQDCDGSVDEDAEMVWYEDADGDGFTGGNTVVACEDPDAGAGRWLAEPTIEDCDDLPEACGDGCFPGNSAPDVCDGHDQDCDREIDEEPDTIWYHDADGDGYPSQTDTQIRCTDPDGGDAAWLGAHVAKDCDDNPATCGSACFPGNTAADVCDGRNQDCDEAVDEDEATLWYRDADNDGFTDNTQTLLACEDPDGPATQWVSTATAHDCADEDEYTRPGASEICDGNDNDCDGNIPEDESDLDSDGYVSCSGWFDPQNDNTEISGGQDCADDESRRSPGLTEICDGLDNDCSSEIDDGLQAVCACFDGAPPWPLEVCGNGVDDDCDGEVDEADGCVPVWWDCGYAYRLPIEVIAGSGHLFAGYSLSIAIDHENWVASGKSRVDGGDVRVVYFDGSTHTELDLVVDPGSGWNQATTRVWFAVVNKVSAGQSDAGYMLYYGNHSPAAVLDDEQKVFDYADFFQRSDSDLLGGGWLQVEDATDIDVGSEAMRFVTTAEASHQPYAWHTFGPYVGKVTWRFGFNWRRGDDDNYRIYMQLGYNPSPPEATDVPNEAGVAVNLVSAALGEWDEDQDPDHGAMHEGFGVIDQGQLVQLGHVSGYASIVASIDLSEQLYDLTIDTGSETDHYAQLPIGNGLTSVNTVRFMVHKLDESLWTADRSFEYVIVHRTVADDVQVAVGDEQPRCC